MAVQAISIFKVDNSRGRVANYPKSNNYMSRVNILSQPADSFSRSNNSSQISFKGNPMTLVKGKGKLAKASEGFLADAGKKVGGIARRVGEEATEAIGSTARKLKGKTNTVDPKKLPKPQILEYGAYTTPVIEKIIKWNNEHPTHKIKVPKEGDIPGCEAAERTLKSYMVSFGSAIADAVPDAAKEAARGVGSAVASSAAGQTAKAAASEVGQFVAEEVIGEAGMQAIERGLDCILPGAGLLLTGIRWGRRAYKVGKIIDKL